ncbi:type II toxin-antitoxin system RelE/ParE family toxin [Candidatus Peregrinibacteria bacterium]|nr:type II toxin-antitoxin system RelE/ParE family toxin [Candidatus Peregrinibacteria bacterium]
MIAVLYKPTFVRQYDQLPTELQEEVKECIALFQKNPRCQSLRMHKLRGALRGFLSFSVNYRYRIVFQWEGRSTAILLAVGDHDVYR